jgi:hypothetical protein
MKQNTMMVRPHLGLLFCFRLWLHLSLGPPTRPVDEYHLHLNPNEGSEGFFVFLSPHFLTLDLFMIVSQQLKGEPKSSWWLILLFVKDALEDTRSPLWELKAVVSGLTFTFPDSFCDWEGFLCSVMLLPQ